MDYLFLQDFLLSYSLPTLTIALICCIVRLTLEKFFKKLSKMLVGYIPFILAMLLYFGYDMIFVINKFYFTKGALYAGVLSGSLSAIFYSAVKKIAKGKPLGTNATILLIEGILSEYVSQDILTKTALEIEKVLLEEDDSILEKQVVNTLTYNCSSLSSADILHLAKLIIAGAKSLQKT
ncbi:MAG: hypothetical protein E7372_00985 [Clostridiales bacterium]|nr:hypothetical protein [Clostridiales bacterium]